MKQKFSVTGMTCSACSARVQKSVSKLDGVMDVNVNLLTNSMICEYDESVINKKDIIKNVEQAGYGAYIYDNTELRRRAEKSEYTLKLRLISSVILLIPLMYVSMGHMMGLPLPGFLLGTSNALYFCLAQIIFCIPIIIINYKYFYHGFRNLFKLSPNMDSLIAIGSTAAFLYGIYALIQIIIGLNTNDIPLIEKYHMDLYFESAATILTLITVGKYLEARSKNKTSDAINKLISLTPKTARKLIEGKEVEIPIEDVKTGDILIAKTGERIAVDGVIVSGTASLDQAAITGESVPVAKTVGESVISATVMSNGYIEYKATRVGEDTTLAQIINLVEEASSSKAPIAKTADKISGIFVPIIIGIAILALVIWLIVGATPEFAISIAISILVVSCPCALGLATPVAIMVGTGKGAENGILIKSGEALETMHSVTDIVIDKTGTLTEGKPSVTDVITFGINEEDLLSVSGSLEVLSDHPLGNAVCEECKQKKLTFKSVTDYQTEFGKGICGIIDNKKYFIGNVAYLKDNDVSDESIKDTIIGLSSDGKTPLIVFDENTILGIIGVKDKEKKTSLEAIRKLKSEHIIVTMLTGDNKQTAEAIRKRLEIDNVIAEVLPQEKEQKITSLQKEGKVVAMVGDGINDAPALAKADVGIAIGAGVDIAIDSADVVLMKSDINDVHTAYKLSKAVIKNIKENLFWAFFYNVIGIPIAAGVFYAAFSFKLSPMLAAAAMSLSSVCVVLNALRLKMFKIK